MSDPTRGSAASPLEDARVRALACLAVAAVVAATFLSMGTLAAGERFPPIDDALIHVRYAEAIAEGRPWGYVPGDALSTGATSLLWPWLLAPFAAAGLHGVDLWCVAVAIAALSAAVAMDATVRWVGRLAGPPVGWTAALALGLSGPWTWGVASGMEVALVGAALATAIDAVLVDGRRDARSWLALAVLAVVRPEGALLAGLLVGARVLADVARAGAGARVAALRGAWPWALALTAGTVQPLVHLAIRGSVVGSSVLAKAGRWPPLAWDSRPRWIASTLVTGGYVDTLGGALGSVSVALGLVGAAAAWRAGRRMLAGTLLLVLAVPLVVVAGTTSVLVHHARYLQPMLVVWAPLGVLGAWEVVRRLPARPVLVHATLLAVGVAPRALELPAWARTYADDAHAMAWHDGWAARELSARMAPGESVAVNDVGAIGEVLARLDPPRRIVDLEGIATERALPWAAAGEGALLAFLRQERPAWAAVFPAWFPALTEGGVFRGVAAHDVPPGSISGAATKVVARVDLTRADAAAGPPDLAPGERVLDTLDLCDLTDEGEHAFVLRGRTPRPATRVRLGLDARGVEVLDGVRGLPGGASFTLRDPAPFAPARLVLRVAGEGARARVSWDGGRAEVALPDARERGFAEVSVPLSKPADGFVIEPLEGVPLVARVWLVR